MQVGAFEEALNWELNILKMDMDLEKTTAENAGGEGGRVHVHGRKPSEWLAMPYLSWFCRLEGQPENLPWPLVSPEKSTQRPANALRAALTVYRP